MSHQEPIYAGKKSQTWLYPCGDHNPFSLILDFLHRTLRCHWPPHRIVGAVCRSLCVANLHLLVILLQDLAEFLRIIFCLHKNWVSASDESKRDLLGLQKRNKRFLPYSSFQPCRAKEEIFWLGPRQWEIRCENTKLGNVAPEGSNEWPNRATFDSPPQSFTIRFVLIPLECPEKCGTIINFLSCVVAQCVEWFSSAARRPLCSQVGCGLSGCVGDFYCGKIEFRARLNFRGGSASILGRLRKHLSFLVMRLNFWGCATPILGRLRK